MDELEKNKKDAFAKMMSKSKLEMPFSDFEDSIMQIVKEKSIKKDTIAKELRISKLFFVIGTIFGIVLSILLSIIKEPLFGINSNVIALIFQITFATLFFTQVETYFKSSQ